MHANPSALPGLPCYLNGQWLPLEQAQVPVLDRGFMFGDGVYEVVPVYGGRLFRFDEHMERLERSLHAVRIANPCSREDWLALMRQLVERVGAASGSTEQLLYLQITRGVAPRAHPMPAGLAPTVLMMSQPHAAPSAELRHRGLACISHHDFRWERGDIKSISLLGNVMARQLAVDHDADETILLRELCEDEGIACHMRPIAEAELYAADEILLSSAGREVLPVTRLDGESVGHGAGRGKPGPVYARLHEAYQRAKQEQSL